MILNLKYNYEKLLIHNPQYFGNWTFTERRKLNAKMIAVFFHCVVRADTRGNVNREQNKWHRAPVRLESKGTYRIHEKLLPYGPIAAR